MDRTVGFIDVGTNSVHMLVVKFYKDTFGTPIYQDKETVRLGHSLFSRGYLDEETIDKVSKVFASFSGIARRLGASRIMACATCAAREAPNADRLRKLAEENGIEMVIIDGKEEARLTRLGVLGPVAQRRSLLMDIGGGSTEITIADGRDDLVRESLKLGALRMSFGYDFDPLKPISEEDYDELLHCVDMEVSSVSGSIKRTGFETAIGSSGTLIALAGAVSVMRGDGDDSYFTYRELEMLMSRLCSLDAKQRNEIYHIGKSRQDIIIGGGAVAEEIMLRLGIDRIEISPNGLREGMRIDYLLQKGWKPAGARMAQVLTLAGLFGADRAHGDAVRNMSDRLFDGFATAGLVRRDERMKELMGYAAMLSEIGAVAGRRPKGKLTSTIIRRSGLQGFEPDELDTMALLAHLCRGPVPPSTSKVYILPFADDTDMLSRCAMILKIAEICDRGRDGAVRDAEVSKQGDKVHITLISSDDISMVMWKMESVPEEFEKIFGLKLQVVSAHDQ